MSKEGRPTIISETIVSKLIAAFQHGRNDTFACNYAHISRNTFYRHYKEDQEFRDKIDAAKLYAIFLASDIIFNVLNDNRDIYDSNLKIKTAMWWLERKMPEEYGKPVCKNCYRNN